MISDPLRPDRCKADSLYLYFLRELHQTAVGVFFPKLIEIELRIFLKEIISFFPREKKVADDEGTGRGRIDLLSNCETEPSPSSSNLKANMQMRQQICK
jgi:hypothetical protein